MAGWLQLDENRQRGNSGQPCGSGRSEDWHYDIFVDSDFIQRNYAANSQPLATAVMPGYPEHDLDSSHTIPLTGGLLPNAGTFLLPGNGVFSVELNSWHTNIRGGAPSTFTPDPNTAITKVGDTSHPQGCPDDSGIPVPGVSPPAALYPNNSWAFNVLTGSVFPPFPLPPPAQGNQLRAGDYVILTGTLWEDIAHLLSDKVANRQCFDAKYTGQGGWLELHPVDVVRFVTPPPPLRRHPEVVPLCAHPQQLAFLNGVVTPDDPPPSDLNYSLKFQEVVDPRFTDPSTVVEKQIRIDACDPTKLDIDMKVANPNGFAYYKSVVLAWWEKGDTPRTCGLFQSIAQRTDATMELMEPS